MQRVGDKTGLLQFEAHIMSQLSYVFIMTGRQGIGSRNRVEIDMRHRLIFLKPGVRQPFIKNGKLNPHFTLISDQCSSQSQLPTEHTTRPIPRVDNINDSVPYRLSTL